ncbi:MAG: FGGY-family carbohydrate kinase [Halanaerobiales bacterium]|nr:FGGY-family carbohydrate kinase [Halanaerobiales bacterium]
MSKFFLGIDIGTTGCKSAVYDQEGRKVIGDYQEYFLDYPGPKQVEIHPDRWWDAVRHTLKGIVKQGFALNKIKGIGISCTNAILAVDRKGHPLRKAIMQLDQRTDNEIEWLHSNIGEERIFQVTGNRIAPGTFSVPALLWMKNNQPEIFKKAYKFLAPTGYIVYKLTGSYSIDPSRASTTMLFDLRKQDWDPLLCKAIGIPLPLLPKITPADMVVGFTSKEIEEITGLKTGTSVVTGCMDSVAAALGSGISRNGEVFSILGTVGRLGICVTKPTFDNRMVNCCHGLPGSWLSMAAINGTGASYRWFRDNFGQLERLLAEETGDNPYELMNKEAARSPAGARGIIYLPYLAAERSPVWDSNVSAAFLGLKLSHRRADLIRALLEGISLAFRHNLDVFGEELGIKITEIKISGGGASSSLWRQILADVLGVKVHLLANQETETLGAAFLAAKGTGLISGYESFNPAITETKLPNRNNREIYQKLYAIYKELYGRLKATNEQLSQLHRTYFER